MGQEWYVAKDGNKLGPFSSTDLKHLAENKRLEPTDLVWTAGMSKWKEARKVVGLFLNTTRTKQPPLPSRPPPVPPPLQSAIPIAAALPDPVPIKPQSLAVAGPDPTLVQQPQSKPKTANKDKIQMWIGFVFLVLAFFWVIDKFTSHKKASTEKGQGGSILTADFYPFKQRTIWTSMAVVEIDGGKHEIHSRREYTHEGNSAIVERYTMHFARPSGAGLPIPNPKQHLRRENNGFVEIGEEDITGKTRWHPVVKLGAAEGTEWQAELMPGIVERYKLVALAPGEFCNMTYDIATIEVLQTASLAGGKKIEMLEEIKLAKGIGPTHRESWTLEQSGRKKNWVEVFIPPK